MTIRIGDVAPDFTAETTEGKIKFHDWIGEQWAILFSHPKDFTPVCTTELGYLAGLKPEFDKRGTKIIGLSIDPVSDHKKWVGDIQETQGHAINYPLIGDAELAVAKLYDMIHPNASGGSRTAADNQTIRSVFIIGPDKKVKAMLRARVMPAISRASGCCASAKSTFTPCRISAFTVSAFSSRTTTGIRHFSRAAWRFRPTGPNPQMMT
jgi:alkyl hydroperoxide reductase subunit AhpC